MAITMTTGDTMTAAFLLSRGHRLTDVSCQPGNKTYFSFKDSPKLKADIDDLRFGDDSTSARALFSARAHLMRLIHDGGVAP
jgi:hypothetical protein